MGSVSLDFDPSGTRFLVGTENGVVLWCNKKGKSSSGADRVVNTYAGHHGPVYAVQRNPVFSKYFLTVGDWSSKVLLSSSFSQFVNFVHLGMVGRNKDSPNQFEVLPCLSH